MALTNKPGWMGRHTPLRLYGRSGRRSGEGTAHVVEGMMEMARWNTASYSTVPTGCGFEVEANEIEYEADGGSC